MALEDTAIRQRRALVGRNIVAARTRSGLSQAQLAELTGIWQHRVSGWENGHHEPSHLNLLRLAEVLDRPFGWFYLEHPTSCLEATT